MAKLAEVRQNYIRPSGLTASQKVSKKYKRKLWRKECRNLKAIVPSVANKRDVDEVQVIEEAIDYIEQLHMAIAQRLQHKPDFFQQHFQRLQNAPTTSQDKHISPNMAAIPSSNMSAMNASNMAGFPQRFPLVEASFMNMLQTQKTGLSFLSSFKTKKYEKPTS